MKLIPDWRQSWRWLSVQSMGFVTVLLTAWAAIPADLKDNLPTWLVPGFAVSCLLLGIFGRLIVQKKKKPRRKPRKPAQPKGEAKV